MIAMDKVKRIVEDIKSEKQRTDKVFQDITFEIRDTVNEDQNYVKHNHDPVFIDIQELNALKKELQELNIIYHERRDDFM